VTGRSFEDFYQAQRQYISASDERWRKRSLLEYPYLFPQSFSLQLAVGRSVAKPTFPGEEYTQDTVEQRQRIPYLRIPSFGRPNFEADAVKAVHEFAKALILDVRGNHGGNTPVKLVEALMDRPYRWFAEATPVSIGLFKSQGALGEHSDVYWYGGTQPPEDSAYHGEVYVLVDGGCFSACEDFVMPLKNTHRATLVGERTAGSTGQPFVHSFENGMLLQLGTKREFFPNGEDFEGVGIAPDVEVHPTVADVASQRDVALARVLELLEAKP
jgi:carboxyl-terminal processing protease